MNKAELNMLANKAAMTYGLIFGAFLVLRFFFEVLTIQAWQSGFAYILLTMLLPFLALYFAVLFGNKISGETVTFGLLYRFEFFLFFFASTILTLAQYIFYQYINPEYLAEQMAFVKDTLSMFSDSMPLLNEAASQLETPTASVMAFQSIWNYSFTGAILGLPLAAIAKYMINKKSAQQ